MRVHNLYLGIISSSKSCSNWVINYIFFIIEVNPYMLCLIGDYSFIDEAQVNRECLIIWLVLGFCD